MRVLLLTLTILILARINNFANDGIFMGSGNQLIPLIENNISVQKEILIITLNNSKFYVNVYYEFYNPGNEKEILVGFEASSPGGVVSFEPVDGRHPYMNDFCASVDGESVKYNIAYVNDSNYIKNGIIKGKPLQQVINEIDEYDAGFFYVYNFKVKFKKGITKISHTYNYQSSSSFSYNYYNFLYNLTPANRWANRQIDDFTLILEIGDFETFNIDRTFYEDKNDWIINGVGNAFDKMSGVFSDSLEPITKFNMQQGYLIFQKKNFKPKGELLIISEYGFREGGDEFNPVLSFNDSNMTTDSTKPLQRLILKNYPFALRGYVFRNKELNNYYRTLDWYIPDPNYIPKVESLSEEEQTWLKLFE